MLERFIELFGYWAIVIGTFFEGETIAILGGIAANQKYLNYWLVFLAAFGGSLLGDQTWFTIGRVKGKQLLEKRPKWKEKTAKIERMIEKNATLVILIFRFLYGLRNPTPFIIGTSNIPTIKFVLLNIVSAVIWAGVMTAGGFYLGKGMHLIMERMKEVQIFILIAAIIGIGIWYLRYRKKKKNRKKSDQPA